MGSVLLFELVEVFLCHTFKKKSPDYETQSAALLQRACVRYFSQHSTPYNSLIYQTNGFIQSSSVVQCEFSVMWWENTTTPFEVNIFVYWMRITLHKSSHSKITEFDPMRFCDSPFFSTVYLQRNLSSFHPLSNFQQLEGTIPVVY